MILTPLSHLSDYAALNPLFNELADFLLQEDFKPPYEQVVLKGDKLYINVAETTLSPTPPKLEVHRRYIDVHIPLTSIERIGIRSLEEIQSEGIKSVEPFNIEQDFALYDTPPHTFIDVKPGECLICMPDDAHAPLIGYGNIHKLIAKVEL